MRALNTKILSFDQFVNEAFVRSEFQKVMITRRAEIDDSFITGHEYSTKDYWVILTKDDKPEDAPTDLPVLNYDKETLKKFMKAGVINEKQIYNNIQAREKVSSKAEFYKAHLDSGYIIPTVLDAKDIKELKFPIVAKPDNNHSGLGIQVFDKPEDLENADLSKFSSFSEKINIKEEHRFFIWRSEVIQWTERKPMDEETKDISKKEKDKETNFSYILRNETPDPDFLKCIAYFGDYHSDLDFYAVDIAKDENDKLYVFEINSEPGTLFGVLTLVYARIYTDYYGHQMSKETLKLLKDFREKDIKQNTKQNPNWIVKE